MTIILSAEITSRTEITLRALNYKSNIEKGIIDFKMYMTKITLRTLQYEHQCR